jgi:hypothetical protein
MRTELVCRSRELLQYDAGGGILPIQDPSPSVLFVLVGVVGLDP